MSTCSTMAPSASSLIDSTSAPRTTRSVRKPTRSQMVRLTSSPSPVRIFMLTPLLLWNTYYPQWADKLGIPFDFKAKHYSQVQADKIADGSFQLTEVPESLKAL